MPLVTRNSQNANVKVGTTTQLAALTFTDGDLASDTTLNKVKFYDGSTLQDVGKTSFSSSAVVSQSITIGDYTTPTAATSTSSSGGIIENYDTVGTDTVVNIDSTNNRGGEKVTSTALRNSPISLMTMRLKSASGATGTLVYRIRKTSDSSIVATSTTTLNAATLTSSAADYTLNFNNETLPNEDFYAVLEGISTGQVEIIGSLSDTTSNGILSYWNGSVWTDLTRDARMTITYTTVNNVFDNNTATKWTSNSETNPYVYVDMNSTLNLCAIAMYYDGTGSTETEIKIQTSTDASTWTDKRAITTSNLTNAAWNYYRFNIASARYVRIYGTGTSKVLSMWEIKILTKTDAQIFADLGILEISNNDTSLGPSGI